VRGEPKPGGQERVSKTDIADILLILERRLRRAVSLASQSEPRMKIVCLEQGDWARGTTLQAMPSAGICAFREDAIMGGAAQCAAATTTLALAAGRKPRAD
jgi:hypothetical protein